MVQRLSLIAVTILSVLMLTIVGAVSLSPAYASIPTITLNISPNPALPNQPVTFSGQVTPPMGSADTIVVFVFTGSSCPAADDIGFIPLSVNLAPSVLPLSLFTGTAQSDGSYSITATGGFSAGTYAAKAEDTTYAGRPLVLSPCDPFAVSPAIPEYPYGLAILAIFMILAYSVIRRRTRYDYS